MKTRDASRCAERAPSRTRARFGALVVALATSRCAAPAVDDGARPVVIRDGERFYEHALALPSPIARPIDRAGRRVVDVLLHLPDGARIDQDGDGHLVLPPGARIDRVERARLNDGRAPIADVRGARVTDDGQLVFHVLRPERDGAGALFGAEFVAYDDEGQRAAHALIAARMKDGAGFVKAPRASERDAAIGRFLGLSSCNTCHAPRKPAAVRADQRHDDGTLFVHAPTGTQGFYALDALFRDDGLVEDHLPVQPSFASPYARFSCGDAIVSRPSAPRCDDGGVMRATLDVARARAEGDLHARALCDARERLARHMTDAARAAVDGALRACRTGSAAP